MGMTGGAYGASATGMGLGNSVSLKGKLTNLEVKFFIFFIQFWKFLFTSSKLSGLVNNFFLLNLGINQKCIWRYEFQYKGSLNFKKWKRHIRISFSNENIGCKKIIDQRIKKNWGRNEKTFRSLKSKYLKYIFCYL